MLHDEIRAHLEQKILPFWMRLKDDAYGGFYGFMDNNLIPNRTAYKGCILNSRILWTFATASQALGKPELREYADHAYAFLKKFLDPEYGGVYWSVTYDGKPLDTTKHTYCQAFAVYGLAAYYRLTGKQEALDRAMGLFRIIENRCKDAGGYLEALKADFSPESNEKLSENGIMASRTMNTLLHVVEAYAELYRACPDPAVATAAIASLNQFPEKIYNPGKRRMEVFFDADFRSILDMQSYGHDIEGSWLLFDAAGVFLPEEKLGSWRSMCLDLLESSTERGFTDRGLAYEIVNGEKNTNRAWWPQAEAMLGFAFGWKETGDPVWIGRMQTQWKYICEVTIDPREGSEWFNELLEEKPIVEEWKCPYHNGRMCLQLIQADLPDEV